MTAYEIEYEINGRIYSTVEMPTEGWEEQFPQQVLDRIESITDAGACVISIRAVQLS